MKRYNELMTESSLSRIHRHTQDHMAGAITGHRKSFTAKENENRNRKIAAWLKKRGYGVTKIKGEYPEEDGGENAIAKEESLFVVDIKDTGELENDLAKLGNLFDQDSVLIIPKGGKGAYLLGTNSAGFPGMGNKEKVGSGKFGRTNSPFKSFVNGRVFAFEEVEPQTSYGKQAMYKIAEAVDEELNSL